MRISKGLQQAYDLQDLAYEATLALWEKCWHENNLSVSRQDASAIAALVKAWDSCQERVRIHRNKPLPGVMRPAANPKKKPVAAVAPAPPAEVAALASAPQAAAQPA